MNKQDPLVSSSCRREFSPAPESVGGKSVSCMSGLFQWVCQYHTRRKLLTSGKKQEKAVTSSPPQDLGKESVPRCPAVAEEKYRSSVVMRLMGLNEMPREETAVAVKRRRLLGALEKCEEELKSLKKMIENVDYYHPYNGQRRKKAAGEEENNINVFERKRKESSSKGLIESVSEVCREIGWGERREMGRICLALQDFILRDIIEETVREMDCFCFLPLHNHSCTRRLRF